MLLRTTANVVLLFAAIVVLQNVLEDEHICSELSALLTTRQQSPASDSVTLSNSSPMVKQYANAYSKCCGETDGGARGRPEAQCTSEDRDWFWRLTSKSPLVSSGGATLYFAHMRKAGGTSLSRAIESRAFQHLDEPNAAFESGFVRTVKLHLMAGSRKCAKHRFAKETLFVTNIRHPVDRYVSEYMYSNLGEKLGDENSTTEEKVSAWHKTSLGGKIDMSRARKQFIDNWQTRWYTNPRRCKDLDRPLAHDRNANYSYWKSGHKHDTRAVIGPKDLDDAKAVLDGFDVVAIAPYFGRECDIVPWLVLAGSNRPSNTTNEVKNQSEAKRRKPADKKEEVAGNVTRILRDQIRFDLQLFEYAKALVKRRTAIACCIDNFVGARSRTTEQE